MHVSADLPLDPSTAGNVQHDLLVDLNKVLKFSYEVINQELVTFQNDTSDPVFLH